MKKRQVKKIKYPFTYRKFKEIYSKVPRIGIELIIKTPDGVLLTLRKTRDWNGMWHLPGSTLYHSESIFTCINRVARDELGIKVKIKKFLGYIEHFDEERKGGGFGSTVGLVFLCVFVSGKLRGSDQAEEIKFFRQLPKNIISQHRRFIKNSI